MKDPPTVPKVTSYLISTSYCNYQNQFPWSFWGPNPPRRSQKNNKSQHVFTTRLIHILIRAHQSNSNLSLSVSLYTDIALLLSFFSPPFCYADEFNPTEEKWGSFPSLLHDTNSHSPLSPARSHNFGTPTDPHTSFKLSCQGRNWASASWSLDLLMDVRTSVAKSLLFDDDDVVHRISPFV